MVASSTLRALSRLNRSAGNGLPASGGDGDDRADHDGEHDHGGGEPGGVARELSSWAARFVQGSVGRQRGAGAGDGDGVVAEQRREHAGAVGSQGDGDPVRGDGDGHDVAVGDAGGVDVGLGRSGRRALLQSACGRPCRCRRGRRLRRR